MKMVSKTFYNSKTAKTVIILQISEKFMGVLRYQ